MQPRYIMVQKLVTVHIWASERRNILILHLSGTCMITLLARTSLLAFVICTPAAYAQESADPVIIVTGKGLNQTKGDPAYGSVGIDRARLTSEASGRIENILADVAGFQQFRRSDSRSANPSAQGATCPRRTWRTPRRAAPRRRWLSCG